MPPESTHWRTIQAGWQKTMPACLFCRRFSPRWIDVLHPLLLVLFLILPMLASAADEETERRIKIGLGLFPNVLSVDTTLEKRLDSEQKAHLYFVFVDEASNDHPMIIDFNKKIKTIKKTPIVTQAITLSALLKTDGDKDDGALSVISGIFIAEKMSPAEIKRLLGFSYKHHTLVFSPFAGDVEQGATAGIFIGSKILPAINPASIRQSGIEFHPLFLKLAYKYE